IFKRKTVVIDDEDNIEKTPIKEKTVTQPLSNSDKEKINLIKNQIKSSKSNTSKPTPAKNPNKNRSVPLMKETKITQFTGQKRKREPSSSSSVEESEEDSSYSEDE